MENKTRLITLSDSPGMDGELVIFRQTHLWKD